MRQRNIKPVFNTFNPGEVTAIILCAGEAEVIRQCGTNRALTPIGETNLINHQIKTVRRALPGCEIIVVAGHDYHNTIKALPKGVRAVINERWADTSSVHSLDLALKAMVTPSALIISGDLYFDLSANFNQSFVVESDMIKNKPGINEENGVLYSIGFGLPRKYGQITFIKDVNPLKKVMYNEAVENMLMFEIVNKLIEVNVKFSVVPLNVVEINTYKNLQEINNGIS